MKLIRKRRNGYALLFVASICLAVWLGMAFMLEAVLALGAISLISLLLLVRQSRLLYWMIYQYQADKSEITMNYYAGFVNVAPDLRFGFAVE